jgi:hypothetical protein
LYRSIFGIFSGFYSATVTGIDALQVLHRPVCKAVQPWLRRDRQSLRLPFRRYSHAEAAIKKWPPIFFG